MRPETRYAKSGALSIAYQVIGDGPFDLLMIPGFVSHLEVQWEEPQLAQFLDAVGSERAALFGISEGGPLSILFACTYPERTMALIAYGSYARWMADVDYPWGRTPEQYEGFLTGIDRAWETGEWWIHRRRHDHDSCPHRRCRRRTGAHRRE